MRSGQRVADLGCWPGGWLQVASRAVGGKGRVVGVDRKAIDPPLELDNTVSLLGDLEDANLCERVLEALHGPADTLLCDAAPALTGVRATDRAKEERLLECVEALLPGLLRRGGSLVLKILDGPEADLIARRIGANFAESRRLSPRATRKGSAERYLVGRGYRPATLGPVGSGEADCGEINSGSSC